MSNILKNWSVKARLKASFLAVGLILTVEFTLIYFLKPENWELPALALNLGLVALLYFLNYHKIFRPLGTLAQTADHISHGNISDLSTISSSDEIGNISTSLNRISKNLEFATRFVTDISSGNLETELANIDDAEETIDSLSASLLSMREQMIKVAREDRERGWATEGLAMFADILRQQDSLEELSAQIIKNLVKYLNANQGAIFLAQEIDGERKLEMKACYAYERMKYVKKVLEPGEGLVGQAYLEAESIYITEIPEKYITISSGLGEARPNAILMTPMKVNDEVHGVIELATFGKLDQYQIEFIEKLSESIASSISFFNTNERTKRLLEESQELAASLKEQEEELRQNTEELQATQEEVNRRFDEFSKKAKFDQLTSIRSTKKLNIEDYFSIIRNQILSFSEDKMIVNAMKEFKESFHVAADHISKDEIAKMAQNLEMYYENEFLPRLNANTDHPQSLNRYWVGEDLTTYLQYLYISNNPHPTGKKSDLFYANDNSAYSKHHKYYHSCIKNFLERFGYYDIFLIDNETGHIIYSVFKEVDFAASLFTGPYKDTNFGKVALEAAKSEDKNFVRLVDFEPYDPSYTAPASFIATGVFDENGDKIGVLVFQMPIDKINLIMTGAQNWKDDGLGKSGETYLVGDDYKMRSMSRFLIEDPENYFKALKELGYSTTIVDKIKRLRTSILLQEVNTEAVKSALNGETGTAIVNDYRGIPVLSSYTKLDIPDVNWAILSDIDLEEASEVMKGLKF